MLARFPVQALIRRELTVHLRQVRAFLFLAITVGTCLTAVLAIWPEGRDIVYRSGQVSRDLMNIVALTLLTSCALFLPGIAGIAIVSEKESGTFDLLHLTLLRPRAVVLGKLVNALGFFILLTVALLPLVGVIFFLVGVDWHELLLRMGMIGLAALSCASAGLLCSAYFRRTVIALVASYAGMLCVFGGHLLLLAFLIELVEVADTPFSNTVVGYAEHFLNSLANLFPAVGKELRDPRRGLSALAEIMSPAGIFQTSLSPRQYLYACLYQVFLASSCLWLARRVLRRPPRAVHVAQEKPVDDTAVLDARRKCFPYYLIDPLRRPRVVEDGRNPMFVKEMRWGLLGRMTRLVRFFYGALIVDFVAATGCVLMFISADMKEAIIAAMLGLIALTCLTAPALLANALTKEQEQKNLDMLRMTLMTPRQIVLGKLGGGLVILSPLLAAALTVALILGATAALLWFDWGSLKTVFRGTVALLVCVALCLSLAMFASLHVRRSSSAIVVSYVLVLLLSTGPFVAAQQTANWYLGYDRWNRVPMNFGLFESWAEAQDLAHAFSPVTSFFGMRLRGQWAVFPHEWSYWLASMTAFSLVAYIAVALSVRRFRMHHMRD